MNSDGTLKSSQLRHALRTPLNQISGYSEMLIEDLSCDIGDGVRNGLHSIRDNGRIILDLLQKELPPDRQEVTVDQLSALRSHIEGPLGDISTAVARLVTDTNGQASGLNTGDVIRMGSAVAELVEFIKGKRALPTAPEPDPAIGIEEVHIGGEVLVVDDNPGNRDLLERMPRETGTSCDQRARWPVRPGSGRPATLRPDSPRSDDARYERH